MLKVIIVDDEKAVIEGTSELLSLYHPNVTICACCHTIGTAVKAIQEHAPDLVLLDVQLGDESGFDLFRHFAQPAFKTVFVTAHQEYAMQAFRFAALDYLLKPVQSSLLAEALGKAAETVEKEKFRLKLDALLHNTGTASKATKKIVLKTAESIHLVPLGEIMYCEAERGYTNFYLADKSRIMVSTTMGDYEELLEAYGFLRIHQSYLLNLDYFKRYDKADGGMAILKDNSKLPVSTRRKDLLLQRLGDL